MRVDTTQFEGAGYGNHRNHQRLFCILCMLSDIIECVGDILLLNSATRSPTISALVAVVGKGLGKVRSFSEVLALEVENVDGNRDDGCNAGKDRGRPLKLVFVSNVGVD